MAARKRILVVDDDASILDALCVTLGASNYEVRGVSEGGEVYGAADVFKPDLVILDIQISAWDGRVVCKKLKSTQETRSIPVLMISAQVDAASSVLAVGADDFLAKPFDFQTLVTKVERLL